MEFSIKRANRASSEDLATALGIYAKTVDEGSFTSTNQIRDYIVNRFEEERQLFFYVLYADGGVVGFAEFAYLPRNQVLLIDYLSTVERSSVLFYVFYHLVLQEIEKLLASRNCVIRYLVTELSARERDGLLVDADSVYFMQLLSIEGYYCCKAPYFQPPLDSAAQEEPSEFSLAIKLYRLGGQSVDSFISREKYLNIVHDIYWQHYLPWLSHYCNDIQVLNSAIQALYDRISEEYPIELQLEKIYAVSCRLFDEGKCEQISLAPLTVTEIRKSRNWKRLTIGAWFSFCLVCTVACFIPGWESAISKACSILTIIAGIIAIVQMAKSS